MTGASKGAVRGLGSRGRRLPVLPLIAAGALTLAVAAAAGVTVPSFASVHELERQRELVQGRAEALERDRGLLEPFAEIDGFARIDAARALVRELIPSALHEVPLYGTSRVLAARFGLDLSQIDFGSERLGPWPALSGARSDVLYERSMHLSGYGELSALLELLAGLDAAGYPHAVRQLDLTRSSDRPGEFRFNLTLFLFRTGRPPAIDVPVGDREVLP